MQNKRRIVLISYGELINTKLKKLLKISEKIYIFCPHDVTHISFDILKSTQKQGDKIKWVRIPSDYTDIFSYYNFFTGTLNHKLHESFEICIFSNDSNIDPLINTLNSNGRSSIRIRDKKNKKKPINGTISKVIKLENKEPANNKSIVEAANLTVQQLEASGNRPAEAASLKNYILLNSKDDGEIFDILDEVIFFMEENKQIEIDKGIVSYNF